MNNNFNLGDYLKKAVGIGQILSCNILNWL